MVASVSNTVYGIINDAMFDAGYLERGDVPNSDQLSEYMRRLNDIINLWQTQGLKLFLLEDLPIPLVTGQSIYSLGPLGDVDMTKPLRGLQGYVLETVGNARRPLVVMSWNEWMTLSQVTGNNGMISSYFINKQATELQVYFWNPPDATEANNVAHILIQTQVTNPINLEENMAFPQEWRMALRWGLADDICTGQPQAIMDRCAARANTYRSILEDWDVEDAPTRFTPDQRTGYGYGSFS